MILGPTDKLKRATIQADVFLNSQKQIMDMAINASRAAAKSSAYPIIKEVFVDQSLVGLVVGSQGS